ncbi:MAG: FAD-dependent oxidoreductase [Armatimonadetes bacterium]|nr:FAD-dependent oxidoreductase [Armatimonadota bacterium]
MVVRCAVPGVKADVAVIGGGVGGCAAALAAAALGRTVVLAEATDWIGGQLTSQAVPPDEHPWVEMFGVTARYRAFREGVRRYYRDHFPLTPEARQTRYLNPGNGLVSRLCCDPRVALAVLHQMLAPHLLSGRITLMRRQRPAGADVQGDLVRAVTVRQVDSGRETVVEASYFIDATEMGDLLPLAGVEYVVGAEGRDETGEPHAAPRADPRNQQAFTVCVALDYLPGENHTIARPRDYDFWVRYRAPFWPDRQLSWVMPNPRTLEPTPLALFREPGRLSLWLYRRILDVAHFAPGTFASDITLVNWPQNDYWLGPICDVSEDEAARHGEAARQLSLSLLYWMQREAPRPDGGVGYPGLRLRADVAGGTPDGLAKFPYVRESRRIRAEFTVLEQHLASDTRPAGPEKFTDSVGVGCYRIDLHPSTAGDTYIDVGAWPFQIPLGVLLPRRVENLLPGAKNAGVTHITNGCFRLHPVEWNVGEAAGLLAAFCLHRGVRPRAVRHTPSRLGDFQALLTSQGIELDWPEIHPV